jgi:hypothetical protein
MDSLLNVASLLDESGHYELSDKLFKIAQNQQQRMRNLFTPETFKRTLFQSNPSLQSVGVLVDPYTRNQYINRVNTINNLGGNAASKVDEIKGYAEQGIQKASNASALGKLGASISKNLPALIKGLKEASTLLQKVNESPAGKLASKALLVLNAHTVVASGLELLTDLQTQGFSQVWSTDAKRVVQTFANLVALATNPTITAYLFPLATIQPALSTISVVANGVSLAAEGLDAAGGFMGTTNTALRNNQGTYAKSSVMPLDQLSKKYGEVYNVLIDYVNGKGTVKQLITKHIPENNPEKFALVNAHIAQKVLPPKNASYVISSYKRHRDELAVSSQFGGF